MSPDREEALGAWLDGALSVDEAREFEAALADDPELRALAETWRANDALIAGALAPIAQAPLDDALLARVERAIPASPAVSSTAAPAANDNPPFAWRRALGMAGAVAAACAAFLILIGRPASPVDPLSQALDRTASLAVATLPDGARIQPVLTVRAGDGRWCREYRTGADTALACRAPDGRWTVEGAGRTNSGQGNAGQGGGEGIALAGGADPASLDPVYRRLGASDPVAPATEARLIAGRWR